MSTGTAGQWAAAAAGGRQLLPEQGGCVPSVAISAHASQSSREESMRAGFQAHVTKPLHPETVVNTVLRLARVRPAPESRRMWRSSLGYVQ